MRLADLHYAATGELRDELQTEKHLLRPESEDIAPLTLRILNAEKRRRLFRAARDAERRQFIAAMYADEEGYEDRIDFEKGNLSLEKGRLENQRIRLQIERERARM